MKRIELLPRVSVKLMVKVFQVFIIPPSTVFASHKGKLPPTTVIVTALPLPSTHHYLGTDVWVTLNPVSRKSLLSANLPDGSFQYSVDKDSSWNLVNKC